MPPHESSDWDVLNKAADAVVARLGRAPIGVVLGSGLSETLDNIERPRFMDYAEIPGMPTTAIAGHRGALLYGQFAGEPVLALCGRIHTYEGRPMNEVAMPIRLLSLLGVHTLVITSSVGSADPELRPGHVMIVEDHLNFAGSNVLVGPHDPRFGPRFPDMTDAYAPALIEIFEETAADAAVPVSRGILAHFRGPNYETPAEVRMAAQLGARVVSMSMVPEVLVARQRGIRCLGLACVTNMGAGLGSGHLDHDHVLSTSATNAAWIQTLLSGAIPRIAEAVGRG